MAFDHSQRPYRELRSIVAEKTNKLIVWIGSGLSASAGLPTWPELKDRLIGDLREKARRTESSGPSVLDNAASLAAAESNYWTAFEVLQKHLGSMSYRSVIRAALSPALTAPCPTLYRHVWNLRPAGVLTLNLDRFATKALGELTHGRRMPHEFSGRYAAKYLHLLKTPHPFVANLHGITDDVSSWVFTRSELKRLLKYAGYTTLINSCLTTTTILFIGIRADDIAAGGQLAALTRRGVDAGPHYWLTSRNDYPTDQWAEKAGLQVIRYESDETHSQVLDFFRDILQFVPEENDSSLPPVVPEKSILDSTALPNPQSLVQEDADVIRQKLNARAIGILSPGSRESYAEYEAFAAEYDEAIYRAWYTAPGNQLLGYTLGEEAGHGAFGRVYRATAPDGRQVAIKVLLEDVRRKPELLGSFRRGVRAMRFLRDRGVAGMVAYQEASEIPTFVVMDWVDGPTLSQAVEAHYLDDWDSILRIASDIAGVIRRAHAIPERVLHRDLRPSNIMLDRFYSSPDAWEVVVLDFDLSWHMGALEKSVVHGVLTGYLAPEQIQMTPGCSTRHGAVDSFGMGMTLYYMTSGADPVPEQHMHTGWSQTVYGVAARRGSHWRSLPRRYARVILNATKNDQAERWDITQIHDELQRLRVAHADPQAIVSAELVAEEIAAGLEREYDWDGDSSTAEIRLASGATVRIIGSETERRIVAKMNWNTSGRQERRKVGKWIGSAGEKCVAMLKSAGWQIGGSSFQRKGSIALEAAIRATKASGAVDRQVETMAKIVELLSFE